MGDTPAPKIIDLFIACNDHFQGVKLANSDFGLSTNNNYIQLLVTQLRLLRWGQSQEIGSPGWDDLVAKEHERALAIKTALEKIDQIFKTLKAKPPPEKPPPPLRNVETKDGRWKLTRDTKDLKKVFLSGIFEEMYGYQASPDIPRWTIHISQDHWALLRAVNNEIRATFENCPDRQHEILEKLVDAEVQLIDRPVWRQPVLEAAKNIRDYKVQQKIEQKLAELR